MMKTYTITSIALAWLTFLIFEIFIIQWSESIEMNQIRWDLLLILPGLIGITIHYLIKMKNEHIEKL